MLQVLADCGSPEFRRRGCTEHPNFKNPTHLTQMKELPAKAVGFKSRPF